MSSQEQEKTAWLTLVIISIPLIIANMPYAVRLELWKDPVYRAFLIAIPVGIVVHTWQDALMVFCMVWIVVNFTYGLHEDQLALPQEVDSRRIRNV